MAVLLVALSGVAGMTASDALAGTGSISGHVTGAPSHATVPGVEACAMKVEYEGEEPVPNENHCDLTGSDGYYEIGSLENGTYRLFYSPRVEGQNYIPRYSYGAVAVGDGPTSGVDVELPEGGTVRGRVTEELEGNPLTDLTVCAGHGWESTRPICVRTGVDGSYEIIGLTSDIYTLEFKPEATGLPYFGEYYDDELFGSGYPHQPVSVTAGSVTEGIDAALQPAAEVRGTVTVSATGVPLTHTLVCIAPPRSFFEPFFYWDETHCGRTNSSGAYSIKGLPTGQYDVLFSLELQEFLHYFPPLKPEEDGYPTRYWNERSTLAEADLLTLEAPTVVTGVDARLGPPPTPVSSPAPPSVTPEPGLPTRKRKCKPGRHLKTIKGKRRCVRRHPKQHRRRHHHRHRKADRPSR